VRSALSIEEAVRAFLDSRRAKGVSVAATSETYEGRLALLKRWAADHGLSRVRDITADRLRGYLLHLWAGRGNLRATRNPRPLSPETILDYYITARTFFRWLAREGKIPSDPSANVDRPRVAQKQVPALTQAEAAALLSLWTPSREPKWYDAHYMGRSRWRFISTRNCALVCLLLDTGMRRKAAIRLDLADFDWGERMVRGHEKGGKEGRLPFSVSAQRVLQAYIKERSGRFPQLRGGGAFFTTFDGRPVTVQVFRTIFAQAKRSLGLNGKRLSPHVVRHTFATLALLGGADVFTLQKAMMHSSPTVTRRYVDLLDQDLARAHRQFSPVERLLRGR
jgi:site-specific recombinase XerD